MLLNPLMRSATHSTSVQNLRLFILLAQYSAFGGCRRGNTAIGTHRLTADDSGGALSTVDTYQNNCYGAVTTTTGCAILCEEYSSLRDIRTCAYIPLPLTKMIASEEASTGTMPTGNFS